MANPAVDGFIERADRWSEEMAALRPILLANGLDESIKWGKPCYSHDGSNVVILQPFKDHLSLMFFKGALLADPAGVLEEQGPNSRSAKRIRFASVGDVTRLARTVQAYIAEAIDAEEAGLEVGPPPPVAFVQELQDRLANDPAFRAGFTALTPGRQREYNLHFSSPKQAATRTARIDKHADKIMGGKGLRD